MDWPLGPIHAGTQHGTKRAVDAVVNSARMLHLALRVSSMVHRHRRRFGNFRHAWVRQGQHCEQRQHEAETKQQLAKSEDAILARHGSELGREEDQIKSRLWGW